MVAPSLKTLIFSTEEGQKFLPLDFDYNYNVLIFYPADLVRNLVDILLDLTDFTFIKSFNVYNREEYPVNLFF